MCLSFNTTVLLTILYIPAHMADFFIITVMGTLLGIGMMILVALSTVLVSGSLYIHIIIFQVSKIQHTIANYAQASPNFILSTFQRCAHSVPIYSIIYM